MTKRIAHNGVLKFKFCAIIGLTVVILAIYNTITEELLRDKYNGILNKVLNIGFLKFLKNHQYWREGLIFSGLIPLGIFLLIFTLTIIIAIYKQKIPKIPTIISRLFDLNAEVNKRHNLKNDFFFKSHLGNKSSSWPVIIINFIKYCILFAITTLLAINCIQYYQNTNILGFSIIHKSILNNKTWMIVITALIGLIAICLIWNIFTKIFNIISYKITVRAEEKNHDATIKEAEDEYKSSKREINNKHGDEVKKINEEYDTEVKKINEEYKTEEQHQSSKQQFATQQQEKENEILEQYTEVVKQANLKYFNKLTEIYQKQDAEMKKAESEYNAAIKNTKQENKITEAKNYYNNTHSLLLKALKNSEDYARNVLLNKDVASAKIEHDNSMQSLAKETPYTFQINNTNDERNKALNDAYTKCSNDIKQLNNTHNQNIDNIDTTKRNKIKNADERLGKFVTDNYFVSLPEVFEIFTHLLSKIPKVGAMLCESTVDAPMRFRNINFDKSQ
jgi:hypothetical protein